MVTYRQTRNQRIREQKRKVSLRRRQKAIGAALAGSLATALLFGMGQRKTEADGAIYTVKKGDTLFSLSKKFDTSVELLKVTNSLYRDTIHSGQKIQVPVVSEAGTYIVKKGDTLYSVAKKYGVTVEALMEENHLTKETIFTGQPLIVPTHYHQADEGIYTVQAGDTLWNIAMRYDLSLNELKDANKLKENMVLIGQRLIIPGNIEVMEATVAGAADNFTVEFTRNGHAIPLKVAYGTARKYQELAGKTLIVTYKNGAVIHIE